jgi:hypothetical protein
MARFILESNRSFCAMFRREVQKSRQETAGRLFIEGGVLVFANEKTADRHQSSRSSSILVDLRVS